MKDISRDDILKLHGMISRAERIVVTAHMRPDGDAAGSCTALLRYLLGTGKNVRVVLPDDCPDSLAFLTGEDYGRHFLSAEKAPGPAKEAIKDSDLIFCLDFNSFSGARCGDLADALALSSAEKVLIDHHLYPQREAFSLLFSETEISSTCELLFWVLTALASAENREPGLGTDILTPLLAGMTTDTNNFGNSVFPSTLRMASMALEAGVDRESILQHLYNEYGENRLRLLGKLLYSDMDISPDGVACMMIDKEMLRKFNIREGDTEGFVNKPLEIGKVKMSCLLKEDDGYMRVSLRSKKGVSANRCAAEFFHGGGHELAAGGRIYIPDDAGSPAEAREYAVKCTHMFMTREK